MQAFDDPQYWQTYDRIIEISNEIPNEVIFPLDNASEILNFCSKKFGFSEKNGRWWTQEKCKDNFYKECIEFNFRKFAEIINLLSNSDYLYIVISDDRNVKDWIVVKVKSENLFEFFDILPIRSEYLIIDYNFKWIVNDSNEGAFMIKGDIDLDKFGGLEKSNLL